MITISTAQLGYLLSALEAVRRIDAIFDVERDINGRWADERLRVRREASADLVAALETWMRAERAKLSRHAEVAKAIDCMLTRWPAFVSPTTPQKGRCAVSPSAGSRGCSPAPSAGRSAPRSCRPSFRRAYAERGISRFMPTAELCRMVREATRRSGGIARRRADFVSVPFGIVWPSTARSGRRADGR